MACNNPAAFYIYNQEEETSTFHRDLKKSIPPHVIMATSSKSVINANQHQVCMNWPTHLWQEYGKSEKFRCWVSRGAWTSAKHRPLVGLSQEAVVISVHATAVSTSVDRSPCDVHQTCLFYETVPCLLNGCYLQSPSLCYVNPSRMSSGWIFQLCRI